jgi:hypothetical protein
MSKLVVLFLVTTLIFGVCTYIFKPGGASGGLTQTVRDGHSRITETVRGFDYVTD